MLPVLYTLLALVVFIVLTVLIRTLCFKPKETIKADGIKEEVDTEEVIKCLSELVRCKTVSYREKELEDDKEFEKLVSLLPSLYPEVFKKCEFTEISSRALLFKWEGKSHKRASVMMAHYDVVPVNEEGWDKPAFEAITENNVLWGRGTLDTKVTMNAILCAANKLISEGYTPNEDIYFAFSGSEEINGNGAELIVDYFEKNGIELSFVLDEGGAVVEKVFPGVDKPCGLIGISEKGIMNVKLTSRSEGGHASAPKPGSPLVRLSRACTRIESDPFKAHLTPPVSKLFDTLGRHSNLLYRMIFANLWIFLPLLKLICKKSGGELNALMSTTVAFTQAKGSSASNVIPPEASLTANIRLNPKDNVESALKKLKKTVNDEKIDITLINGIDPARISRTDCEEWNKIASAVASAWDGCIVSPYLMLQCSDSRHYGRISDKVYRFSAMDLTSEERASIHGNNERIRFECAKKSVEFYIKVFKKC